MVRLRLSPAVLGIAIHVRLGDFDDRWTASVSYGSATANGLGPTARDALVAALAPLGQRATTILMAQPMMFAASAHLLGRAAV
jgi:hypothetical protein